MTSSPQSAASSVHTQQTTHRFDEEHSGRAHGAVTKGRRIHRRPSHWWLLFTVAALEASQAQAGEVLGFSDFAAKNPIAALVERLSSLTQSELADPVIVDRMNTTVSAVQHSVNLSHATDKVNVAPVIFKARQEVVMESADGDDAGQDELHAMGSTKIRPVPVVMESAAAEDLDSTMQATTVAAVVQDALERSIERTRQATTTELSGPGEEGSQAIEEESDAVAEHSSSARLYVASMESAMEDGTDADTRDAEAALWNGPPVEGGAASEVDEDDNQREQEAFSVPVAHSRAAYTDGGDVEEEGDAVEEEQRIGAVQDAMEESDEQERLRHEEQPHLVLEATPRSTADPRVTHVVMEDSLAEGPSEWDWAPRQDGLLRELAVMTTTETSATATSTSETSATQTSSGSQTMTSTGSTTGSQTMTSTGSTTGTATTVSETSSTTQSGSSTKTETSTVTSTFTSTATSTITTQTLTATSTSSQTTATKTSDTASTTETSSTTATMTSETTSMTETSATTATKTSDTASTTETSSTTPTATESETSSATSSATSTGSSSATSSATSTGSSTTTSTAASTTTAGQGTIEFAFPTRQDFTTLLEFLSMIPDGADPDAICASLPAILSNPRLLNIAAEFLKCVGWTATGPASGRRLTGGQSGFFTIEVNTQSELDAAVLAHNAGTLNTTELEDLLTEAGFENVEVLAVTNLITSRDEQPWTSRGQIGLTIADPTLTDDEIGNTLMQMFEDVMSNLTTNKDEGFAIYADNVTVFRISRNTSTDDASMDTMQVFFFINTDSADKDLAVLGQLAQNEYEGMLQQALDDRNTQLTISFYRVVYDVFGKILIRSDADLEENQKLLTDPDVFDIEAMKAFMRDSAMAEYELGIEEVGISVANIYPFDTNAPTANMSNRIEVAYLYNPPSFEQYCEIATDQASLAGQSRLELSLSYIGVNPNILPVIETFYQDDTLSCAGSSAEEYEPPDQQAIVYVVLFALGLLLCLSCCIFAFVGRKHILAYWAALPRAKEAKGDEEDLEAPMPWSTISELHGTHPVPQVRASNILVNLPPADGPGGEPEPASDVLRVAFDEGNEEPEIERGCRRGDTSGHLAAARGDTNFPDMLDYEDDEPAAI